MNAPAEKTEPRTWRIAANVWLREVAPKGDEVQRWETEITGTHPCRVTLAKRSGKSFRGEDWVQWCASVGEGNGYHSHPLHALLEAQVNAVDNLKYQANRVWGIDFEMFVRGEP